MSMTVAEFAGRWISDKSPQFLIDLLEKAGKPGLSLDDPFMPEYYDLLEQYLNSTEENEERPKKRRRRARALTPDQELAAQIDEIQVRLIRPDPSHYRDVAVDGRTLRVYRPPVRRQTRKVGGVSMPFIVYNSIDPQDPPLAMTPEDFERYATGDWQDRSFPLVSRKIFDDISKWLRGMSDFTSTCAVGGEPFEPLLQSKVRQILRKEYAPPHTAQTREQLKETDKGTSLKFATKCYPHWIMLAFEQEIREMWTDLSVKLQHLSGEELREARRHYYKDMILKVHRMVRGRNRTAKLTDLEEALELFILKMSGRTKEKAR